MKDKPRYNIDPYKIYLHTRTPYEYSGWVYMNVFEVAEAYYEFAESQALEGFAFLLSGDVADPDESQTYLGTFN